MTVNTSIRDFDAARDLTAVERIWREVGWVEDDDDLPGVGLAAQAGDCVVGCIDDVPECAVMTAPGTIRHLDTDLELCTVTAVTTSHIGRKLGFAQQLTARVLGRAAANGAEVAALGMFDQGFYNRVGFGNGAYTHRLWFDPALLRPGVPYRTPTRLTTDHVPDMHRSMHQRLRGHGACSLTPLAIMQAEAVWLEQPFGLGYYDGDDLTHFVWGRGKGEHGPYEIVYYAFRTYEQFLELLAALHALADQVNLVGIDEPAGIQLQDLLATPFRGMRGSRGGKKEQRHDAIAWWQARILDVAACLEKTHLDCDPLRFNLALTDPADQHVAASSWAGCGGDYVITLGADSAAEPGNAPELATLEASVNAFSRMWLGVRDASSLSRTDHLRGPQDLLSSLDRALRLPTPVFGWDF